MREERGRWEGSRRGTQSRREAGVGGREGGWGCPLGTDPPMALTRAGTCLGRLLCHFYFSYDYPWGFLILKIQNHLGFSGHSAPLLLLVSVPSLPRRSAAGQGKPGASRGGTRAVLTGVCAKLFCMESQGYLGRSEMRVSAWACMFGWCTYMFEPKLSETRGRACVCMWGGAGSQDMNSPSWSTGSGVLQFYHVLAVQP